MYMQKRKQFKARNPKYINKSLYKTAKLGYFKPQNFLPSTFPKTQVVKMRYTCTQAVGGSTHPTMSYINYCANDIHNPTASSTNQPLGYDEWAQFYERYQVIGSKCKATIFGTSISTAAGMIGYLLRVRNTSASLSGDIDVQMQQPLTKYTIGRNGGSPAPSVKDGNGPVVLTQKFSCKKWFTLKDVNDNIDTGANFGSSPDVCAYYTCIFGAMGPLEAATDMNIHVQIDYIVLLSIPKTLAGSSL